MNNQITSLLSGMFEVLLSKQIALKYVRLDMSSYLIVKQVGKQANTLTALKTDDGAGRTERQATPGTGTEAQRRDINNAVKGKEAINCPMVTPTFEHIV